MKILKITLVGLTLVVAAFSIPPVRFWMVGNVVMPVVGPRTTKNNWDSKLVLNDFYVWSKSRNYVQAHLLLSKSLRKTLTVQTLKQQWQAFEQAHGSIKNWQPARGGSSSVWPDYENFSHTITGTKNGVGKVSARLVPENGTWRISQLSIRP